MSTARRILIPGALIAIPVAFAIGSVALAQMPAAPQLPGEPLTVRLAEPAASAPVVSAPPVPEAPAPPPPAEPAPPAPDPVPVPPVTPVNDDDDDNDGGDGDD